MKRLVPLFVGAWLVAHAPRSHAEVVDDAASVIAAGANLEYVAQKGTKPEILGMGFDAKLSPKDATGKARRVYPLKTVTDEDEEFTSYVSVVEDSLSLDAHARWLFGKAGVKVKTDHRYVVLGAQYVTKTVHLEAEGEPLSDAPLYASRVNYGWAVYMVIEGDSSTFTADLVHDMKVAGVDLQAKAEKHGLRVRTKLLGLTAKEDGAVVIPTSIEDITRQFKAAKKPVPISVEYTALQEFTVAAIPWELSKLATGRYSVDVAVTIAKTDTRGKLWDLDGTLPDTAVRVVIDDKIVATCRKRNTVKAECKDGFVVVDVSASTRLRLEVVDVDDWESNDVCGDTADVTLTESQATPDVPFALSATGQILSAVVTLHPVR